MMAFGQLYFFSSANSSSNQTSHFLALLCTDCHAQFPNSIFSPFYLLLSLRSLNWYFYMCFLIWSFHLLLIYVYSDPLSAVWGFFAFTFLLRILMECFLKVVLFVLAEGVVLFYAKATLNRLKCVLGVTRGV